jgi:hypothetical protein
MPRGQPCARKRPPQSSGHTRTSQRHGWRRRLKSATLATAVCCPDESCLTALNSRGEYQQRLAWDLVQLRTRQEIASLATVSRSGLGPLDLVVSDCRLQHLAFAQVRQQTTSRRADEINLQRLQLGSLGERTRRDTHDLSSDDRPSTSNARSERPLAESRASEEHNTTKWDQLAGEQVSRSRSHTFSLRNGF